MAKTIQNKIRVRIAPSPTGALHVGTARTALFNFLFAKHNKGTFILRIEDTDKKRSEKKWEEDITSGLSWLGIKWDGDIYKQSERHDTYEPHIKKLLDNGNAFYCSHTSEELDKEQKEQSKNKEAPRHLCSSRDKKFEGSPNKDDVIRFKNPGGRITFKDIIRGEIAFDADLMGDFSIARNTKDPLYNFAVTVDDYAMKISHVIRGEDHISNTPKQILLQKALGFTTPEYAHLPLVLGEDRSKLSKRHGPVSLTQYKKDGYLPGAMNNFLVLLGWNPNNDKEIFSLEEIVKQFDLSNVQESSAIFDIKKLDWMNGMYIRSMDLDELTALCVPYIESDKELDVGWFKKIVALEQERMHKLSEINERTRFFFQDTLQYNWKLLLWKDMKRDEIKEVLQKLEALIEKMPNSLFSDAKKLEKHIMPHAEREENRGVFLWPLRVALSGQERSPGPFEILAILGKERSQKRVADAKALVSAG